MKNYRSDMNIPRTECKNGHPLVGDNKLRRTRMSYGKEQEWFICRECTGQRDSGEGRSHKKKMVVVGKFSPDPSDPDVQRARAERLLAIQRNPWLGTYLEKTA